MVKKVEGGILAAKGYSVASKRVGIKASGTNRDLTLIKSEKPAMVVGTFTRNIVKAAPVKWDMEVVERGIAEAIVVNTGIANASTGAEGYENCKKEAEAVAEALGVNSEAVLTASTGVIGPQIPVDKITAGIKDLAGIMVSTGDADAVTEAREAAKAIMTTDTVPKEIAVEFEIGGKTCRMGAMCKGSGMIHPNMGTMLGFLLSDLSIEKTFAQKLLRAVVERTFNMVSVDGDTSTNDTFVWLSNGLSEVDEITADSLGVSLDDIDETGDKDIRDISDNQDYKTLYEALYKVCRHLAICMARDGEGATRLFTVKVVGAPDYKTAKTLAKSIVTSSLTKAAVYGRDANCGRIMCAMGYSGAEFDPDKTDITMMSEAGSIKLIDKGRLPEFSEEEAIKILTPDEIIAICDIHAGDFSAEAWGCDLTHEYVTINADYRS